jgi:uncharacterized membrane protein HdeD (DUF308 family)
MQKWTRWPAWVALLAGAYAALSPLWTRTNDTATWTMVALGVVTAAIALWSLAMAEDRISEYALIVMGVLFIVSPWVMNFERLDNIAMTAWVVGAITLVAGVLAMPQVESRMHMGRHHGPIAH